jgi:mannose-1-phosphate guanylyltransferase
MTSALLLAGGYGTRLRPLTDALPKCLVPIRGRPLIDFWVSALVRADVKRIVVNTHYLAELVLRYLSKNRYSEFIEISHEPRLLGTGGSLLKHRGLFDSGPVLVAHADNLSALDVAAVLLAYKQRPVGCDHIMVVFRSGAPSTCGIVEIDGRRIVTKFQEKPANPKSNLANAAVYVFGPKILPLLESCDGDQIDLSTEIIPRLVGRIQAVDVGAYHEDIGTMDRWRRAQDEYVGPVPSPSISDDWQQLIAENDGYLERVIRHAIEQDSANKVRLSDGPQRRDSAK